MPLFNETLDLLQRVFKTKNAILMMPGPGTGALEAAMSSMIPLGQGLVVVTNGHFGQRMARISAKNALHTYIAEYPDGQPADVANLRARVETWLAEGERLGHRIRGIALVHHETSTGVLNPLPEIAALAKEYDLAVIVDAVASLGGTPMEVDAWGIDACVSVPNKALAGVPGVGLLSISERGWQMAADNPTPHGWYYDLNTWAEYRDKWSDWHPYPTTLPTNVIVALNRALHNIFEVGLEAYIVSHAEAAAIAREGMARMGFPMLPDASYAAPVVSAFRLRADVAPVKLHEFLRVNRGIMISGGLDHLAGKIIRVGHMGRAKESEYVEAFLSGVHDFLIENRLPLEADISDAIAVTA